VTNCILWGNVASSAPEIYVYSDSHPSVTYSDVQGGWPGWGNIDADPLFVGGEDFHLTMWSPCIDAGTDAGVYADIDDDPRPQSDGFDMGADEYPECWDMDLDGYRDSACGGDDCDDTDPDIHPGAVEICSGGTDEDCDGLIDSEDPACTIIHVPADQPTIQAAIDAAGQGNRVLVAPGIYGENLFLQGKALILQSQAGPQWTVIDGNRTGRGVTIFYFGTEGIIIDGFTIRNGLAENGGGIFCATPSPSSLAKIKNCRIAGNFATNGGGIYCELGSELTVTDCLIMWNGAGWGGGVYCAGGSSPEIEACTIRGNFAVISGGGLYGLSSSPTIVNCTVTGNIACFGGGGLYSDLSSPEITHCTISGNTGYFCGGGILCSSSDPVITNVILWGNDAFIGAGEICLLSGTLVVTYSDVQGGWEGEGNIDADPLFAGGRDLHLTFGSPCIDSGADAGIYRDMDGDSRPQGAGFDIGADEYPDSM